MKAKKKKDNVITSREDERILYKVDVTPLREPRETARPGIGRNRNTPGTRKRFGRIFGIQNVSLWYFPLVNALPGVRTKQKMIASMARPPLFRPPRTPYTRINLYLKSVSIPPIKSH